MNSLRRTKNERLSRSSHRKEHFKGESREEKLEKFREFRYDSKAEREMRRRGMAADMRSEISTMTEKLKGNVHIKDDPSELLEKMNKSRESRQRECEEKLTNDVSEASRRLRENVEKACSELRSNLDDIESNIEAVFERFGDEDRLASVPVSRVMDAWTELKALCEDHRSKIQTFSEKLEQFEKSRMKSVSILCETAINRMISIGQKLPPVIERYVENVSYECNMSVTSNLIEYESLLSLLSNQDTNLFAESKNRHITIVYRWRLLRHNRSIENFNNTLDSDDFVNPERRRNLFRSMYVLF